MCKEILLSNKALSLVNVIWYAHICRIWVDCINVEFENVI